MKKGQAQLKIFNMVEWVHIQHSVITKVIEIFSCWGNCVAFKVLNKSEADLLRRMANNQLQIGHIIPNLLNWQLRNLSLTWCNDHSVKCVCLKWSIIHPCFVRKYQSHLELAPSFHPPKSTSWREEPVKQLQFLKEQMKAETTNTKVNWCRKEERKFSDLKNQFFLQKERVSYQFEIRPCKCIILELLHPFSLDVINSLY